MKKGEKNCSEKWNEWTQLFVCVWHWLGSVYCIKVMVSGAAAEVRQYCFPWTVMLSFIFFIVAVSFGFILSVSIWKLFSWCEHCICSAKTQDYKELTLLKHIKFSRCVSSRKEWGILPRTHQERIHSITVTIYFCTSLTHMFFIASACVFLSFVFVVWKGTQGKKMRSRLQTTENK